MTVPATGLHWTASRPDALPPPAPAGSLLWTPSTLDSPEARAATARRHQEIQFPGLLAMLPLVSLIRVVALPICAWLWPDPGLSLSGAALMAALILLGLLNLLAWSRFHAGTGRVAPRWLRRSICASLALGAVGYALLLLQALPLQTEGGRVVLSVFAVAYLGGGAWMYSAVPAAALGWIGAACLTLGLGLLAAPMPESRWLAGLVPLMALFLAAMVMEARRRTRARLLEEDRIDAERQMLQLLLHDFETHADDWLWELDRDGLLRHVSVRLAQTLDRPVQRLLGQPLFELLEPADGGSADLLALRERLQQARPFSNQLLCWRRQGQPQWWLLRARPLLDANGRWIGWRGVTRDITELELRSRELQRLALSDTMTGLPNRHALLRELEQAGDHHAGLALLDLDGFRQINERLGPQTGDAVLLTVAQRLAELAPPLGMGLARLDGDRFALHWRQGGIAARLEPGLLAQTLRGAVEGGSPLPDGSLELRSSLGLLPADGEALPASERLRRAGIALTRAKSRGGRQHCVYEPALEQEERERQRLIAALREAIAQQQIELVYQPKWRLADGSLVGAEALARWTPPGSGPIPPAVFVPLAESAGLIQALGQAVLRRACREAAAWDVTVAVNVSALQFEAPDFVEQVLQALKDSGLPPQHLELELTESVFVQAEEPLVERLRALRSLGIAVALDDFGTGYSSLAYLQRLPLSTLKIDRAFVRDLLPGCENSPAGAIVAAIVQLARAVGANTVAEGIETEAQRQALLSLGCEVGQGYWLSPPLSAAQLAALEGACAVA
jgi:diguanylate cyclase (GGDEF)-like protein/PAS domain S-box-containing protein